MNRMNVVAIWPVLVQKPATVDVNTTVIMLPAADIFVPAIVVTLSLKITQKFVKTQMSAPLYNTTVLRSALTSKVKFYNQIVPYLIIPYQQSLKKDCKEQNCVVILSYELAPLQLEQRVISEIFQTLIVLVNKPSCCICSNQYVYLLRYSCVLKFDEI